MGNSQGRGKFPAENHDPDLYALNAIEILPPEIWRHIFKLPHGHQPNSIVKLRQVCSLWRDIIDENFDFNFILKQSKKYNPGYSHIRVKECTIKCLEVVLPTQNPIFRNPNELKKLTLMSPITRENFMTMADQCLNVVEFMINGECVNSADVLLYCTEVEKVTLRRFYGKLEKLEVTGIDLRDKIPGVLNFLYVVTFPMPKLKILELSVVDLHLHDAQELNYLVESAPNLKRLRLTCFGEYTVAWVTTLETLLPDLISHCEFSIAYKF